LEIPYKLCPRQSLYILCPKAGKKRKFAELITCEVSALAGRAIDHSPSLSGHALTLDRRSLTAKPGQGYFSFMRAGMFRRPDSDRESWRLLIEFAVKCKMWTGGFFGILTEEGERLNPVNLPVKCRQNGLRVRGTYRFLEQTMSIQMWGQPVELLSITCLESHKS
jgi:hypothetical protein